MTAITNCGLRRLKSIIKPDGPLPISRSAWWAGVKSGRFPAPVKLGPRITAWKDVDIQRLVENGLGSNTSETKVCARHESSERSK